MAELQEIHVPYLGDFEDVDVVEVLVVAGDAVTEGQTLITLESDKATMEIPSPFGGVVRQIDVIVGDRVSHGSLIARLEASVSTQSEGSKIPGTRAEPENRAQVSRTPPAPSEPLVATSGRAAPEAEAVPKPSLPYASPSVRAMARELGVDLEHVSGTGDAGRITHDDVRSFVKRVVTGSRHIDAQDGALVGTIPWPRVDFGRFGPVERRDLSRIRKLSAANLHRNWVTIPHVTNHEEADVTELEEFRQKINRENPDGSAKVTMLSLLIKASVAALKRFPEFNASLDGEQIVLKGYYHIGFAADTRDGLLVPVVRDADRKGILEIAEESAALATKARDGRLTLADMSGGSFTISSLGGLGGTYFTPIINAPEVAILGAGRASTRVVWNGERPVPRLVLPLSLSWDHRVVDGAAAGRFNAFLAETLADLRRAAL